MPKRLIQFIFILIALLFAMDAKAGIIIKPMHNFGLVGYWDFQEGAGNNVYDRSGQGNTGTWYGTGSHWTNGKIGAGGSFNGSNDRVMFSSVDTTDITISAWVYPQNCGSGYWCSLVSNVTGNFGRYVAIREGTVYKYDDTSQYGNISVQDNVWTHVVITRVGSTKSGKIYVNGVFDIDITGTANSADVDRIGMLEASEHPFNGKIDEVRIYNRALSSSEVERLYKLSQPKVGINRLGPVADDLPANAAVAYVREDCSGYSPCYHSLYDWEAAYGGIDFSGCTPGDLTCANVNKTAVAKIDGPWAAADPDGAVTIYGWTTDATRYIKIYTTASARHNGKWDDTKYRLESTGSNPIIEIDEEYTHIDGLQVKKTSTGAEWPAGIFAGINNINSEIKISNNIIRANLVGLTNYAYGISAFYDASSKLKIWNNVIYGWTGGTGGADYAVYAATGAYTKIWQIYNNTIYGNDTGMRGSGGNIIIRNNILYGNTDNYDGSFDDYSTNNLSGPSSDADIPSTNARNGVRVAFVDAANDDFHLLPGDSGARNYGTDLSNDASISYPFDIDRQDRKGTWDIGADEATGTIVNASQNNQITNGLVGFWSFNGPDIDGNEAIDRSGQGNTGTITGATVINGKVGQALSFNGTSDKVDVSNVFNDIASGNLTISAWVKFSSSYGVGSPVMEAFHLGVDYSTNDVELGFGRNLAPQLTDGLLRIATWTGQIVDAHSTQNTWQANTWYHIAGTIADNDKLKLYLNGNLIASGDMLGSRGGTPSPSAEIGCSDVAGTNFNGIIDEVRVYNRVLTAQEILRLYNMGR